MNVLQMIDRVVRGADPSTLEIKVDPGMSGSIAIACFTGAENALVACNNSRAAEVCLLKNLYMEKQNAKV